MSTNPVPPPEPEGLRIRAAVTPASVDPEARSVEIVWSTGEAVRRIDWNTGAEYMEALSLKPAHVRLGRLNAGAPLLNAHRAAAVSDVIGACVPGSARIEGGEGRAVVVFSERADVEPVWRDVVAGILRNVSVGYRIHKFAPERRVKGSEIPVREAIDWEPFEVSLVPIGADAGASTRAMEDVMKPNQGTNTTTAGAVEAERQRAADITYAVRIARLEGAVAQRLIADGATVEQARTAIVDELIRRDEALGGPSRIPDGAPHSAVMADDFRGAASDALLLRAGIRPVKAHPGAGDVNGSVLEIARTCVGRVGRAVRGGAPEMLVRAAMGTSEFPLILADSLHKAIRAGFENEPASHREWVRVTTVRDFKSNIRPILGSAPGLERVLEHGEYTQGPISEDSASYAVEKFGRVVALSWEALVNDDLGAFLRVQPALGQAARRKEADVVYALFAANAGAGPTMQDSVALFHSTHGNVTEALDALDADALSAARVLLRRQTALGGGYLSLVPRFLIVAPEHEQTAEVLLAAATRVRFGTSDNATEGGVEWISRLQLVVEPRLDETAAYLAADAAQIDTIELGLLEGNEAGPMIEEEKTFLVDAFAWKARHVFGAKALDWRGLVKIDLSGT